MAVERQSTTLPPAVPSCILRLHASHIHSVQFVRQNSRLLTGDADGWVVYWKVETKRPLGVWRAHDGPVVGFAEWGTDKIITHGRDYALRVWQLRHEDDLEKLSVTLPVDPKKGTNPKPWLLHAIPVNTLNFCSFSMCSQHPPQNEDIGGGSILVAVPATDDHMIDVYRLPGEQLKVKIPRVQTVKTGMVMAVKLVRHRASQIILLLAGYEGGITAAFKLPGNCTGLATEVAELIYLSQPHSEPILSLDVSPDGDFYFTSSADAIVAMHQIPELSSKERRNNLSGAAQGNGSSFISEQQAVHGKEDAVTKTTPLSSSAQNRLSDRPPDISSAKMALSHILADSPSTLFAKQSVSQKKLQTSAPSGLSSALSSLKPQCKIEPAPPIPLAVKVQSAYKVSNTAHAGQQSLRVRSDGRLLVTGGWDCRIRIYSSRTLKEVAVLKWHLLGVYAVAFSDILTPEELGASEDDKARVAMVLKRVEEKLAMNESTPIAELQTRLGELYKEMSKSEAGFREAIKKAQQESWFTETLKEINYGSRINSAARQREKETKLKHYVAAGAKDGKVTLWEVY